MVPRPGARMFAFGLVVQLMCSVGHVSGAHGSDCAVSHWHPDASLHPSRRALCQPPLLAPASAALAGELHTHARTHTRAHTHTHTHTHAAGWPQQPQGTQGRAAHVVRTHTHTHTLIHTRTHAAVCRSGHLPCERGEPGHPNLLSPGHEWHGARHGRQGHTGEQHTHTHTHTHTHAHAHTHTHTHTHAHTHTHTRSMHCGKRRRNVSLCPGSLSGHRRNSLGCRQFAPAWGCALTTYHRACTLCRATVKATPQVVCTMSTWWLRL
jgi:hypothetical protein